MGAEGSIHVFKIKDLTAWNVLQDRFAVRAYVYPNFLETGITVAWQFQGDWPATVSENIYDVEEMYWDLSDITSDHPLYSQNFRKWAIQSRVLQQVEGGEDWIDRCDPEATVGEFVQTWKQAIAGNSKQYEVWT